MELRHLRYIVAVAEELHFGRAATRLNISQPPLSLQIRKTEDEFGVKIFNRTKREVRLTEAGKRIVAEAYQVLDQVDRFERVVSQASEGEIGHLSVGALNGVSEILVKTLAVFGKRYPGVHIDLEYMCTGDQIQGLREGKIQVGFLVLPNQDGVFVGEAIKKAPLTLALPEG
ncbi:MAG TPA: LysR family transcriptional regulator, partial [Terriglobia bacterium]|nr:LysR family transcriptional regulator [Terriglobia bacterium]